MAITKKHVNDVNILKSKSSNALNKSLQGKKLGSPSIANTNNLDKTFTTTTKITLSRSGTANKSYNFRRSKMG